jgi:hypothetical protein
MTRLVEGDAPRLEAPDRAARSSERLRGPY